MAPFWFYEEEDEEADDDEEEEKHDFAFEGFALGGGCLVIAER